MARVVVLGSTNTDMTVRLARLPKPGETRLGGAFATSPGGKGANQAVAASRAGGEVAFLTAVGDDSLGRESLEYLRRERLDLSRVRTITGVSSGVALIFVESGGENMIAVAPGANAHLAPDVIDNLPEHLFAQDAIFLASLEVPVATVVRGLRRAKAARMITVLNPSPTDSAILDREVLALVDVLTPNEEEANALASALSDAPYPQAGQMEVFHATRQLRAAGVGRVVVTLGSRGCLVAADDTCHLVASPRVDVVDTVGAGDVFNGALAVALAEGRPLLEAAGWACAAGALAVTRPGAQGASPLREEIGRLADGAPPPRLLSDTD